MNIDYEAQERRNIERADNPVPGDRWRERLFCFTCDVLAVGRHYVTVRQHEGTVTKTRREFAKWLRYDSIPDKTWSDCLPLALVNDDPRVEGRK